MHLCIRTSQHIKSTASFAVFRDFYSMGDLDSQAIHTIRVLPIIDKNRRLNHSKATLNAWWM